MQVRCPCTGRDTVKMIKCNLHSAFSGDVLKRIIHVIVDYYRRYFDLEVVE